MRQKRKGRRKRTRQKKQQGNKGDEALLRQACHLHQQGEADAAQQAYRQFLARHPQHGQALGNLGLLLHGQGRVEEAVEQYRRALEVEPGVNRLLLHLGTGLLELGEHDEARACLEKIEASDPAASQAAYHLGLLLFSQEEYEEAVHSFTAVARSQPDNIDAIFNLALCHKALGQMAQAENWLRQAAGLAPEDSEILYNIGVLYKLQGLASKAEDLFLQALAKDPLNGICLTDLAILYHGEGRIDEARSMYERALSCDYQVDSARHMLAALNGETTPASPPQHIRDLFNNYAGIFDHSLVQELLYNVPGQLAEVFAGIAGDQVFEATVDLGCGTGLSGLAFRTRTRQLVGVDLSEKMLLAAANKSVYDELHCAEIIDYLQEEERLYNLALAMDVFVYLGGLSPFLQAVKNVLAPGGYLLFSVEGCEDGYCLRQSGRYAHSPAYITELLDQAGLQIICQQDSGIRKERGAWIPGELYVVQRPK